MPFVRLNEATTYETHGARFTSYASSASGAEQLAAWTTEIPAGTAGAAHVVDREEVLRVASGRLRITIDGQVADLEAGDLAIVPAGAELCADNLTDEPATMWATTTIGLSATLADGTQLRPPWAN